MKNYFLLLLQFICINTYCQFYNSLHSPIVGEILSDNFVNGNNWTLVGTNDFAYTNKLAISGANTSAYDKYIRYNNSNNTLKSFEIKFDFTVKDVSASSNGFAVGFTSINPSNILSQALEIVMQNGSIACYTKQLGFATVRTAITGISITCSLNDLIKASFEVKEGLGTITFVNVSTGQRSTSNPFDNYFHNSGRLTIWSLGGTHEINNIYFLSNSSKTPDLLIFGDSQAGEYSSILAPKVNYFFRMSGSGDATTELIQTYNLVDIRPKKVLIELGINDIFRGVSLATYQANINTLINYYTARGATVYVLQIPPLNSATPASWNTSNASLGWNMVNVYSALLGTGTALNPIYDSGDGTHWNTAGHNVVANAIKTSLGL